MRNIIIEEVEWIDAQSGFDQPISIEELKDMKPLVTHSIGYLLYECKDHIILGFMVFGDEVKHAQLIPKGMIRKRKTRR